MNSEITSKPSDEDLLELFDLIYRTGDTEMPTCVEFARAVLEHWGS